MNGAVRVTRTALRVSGFAVICLVSVVACASSAKAGGPSFPSVLSDTGTLGSAPTPTALALGGAPVSVASAAVSQLQGGETLNVSVEAELTDDVIVRRGAGFQWLDAPVTSEVVLAASPSATTGTVLGAPVTGIVSWREHHAAIGRDAQFVVPASLQGQTLYVNLVLRGEPLTAAARCFDYLRATATFAPSAAGCAVHIENDSHLVHVHVLRIPAAAASGFAVQPLGTAPAADATLPIPYDSSSPGYGKAQVVWSSPALTTLNGGDLLEANVQLQADIRALTAGMATPGDGVTGCNVMLSGRLYLSPYPDHLPAPGDPLGNAVPALEDGYAFNLTQSQPQAVAGFHALWRADGNYTFAAVPRRYIVLAAWSSGSQACQAAARATGAGLHVSAAGSSGFAVRYYPAAGQAWGTGLSSAGANASSQLGRRGSPRVLSVIPVVLRPGDVVTAEGEAAAASLGGAVSGAQLVLGSAYTGPQDVSGTPLSASGQAATDPGSDRSLLEARGLLQASGGGLAYVKLIGWSSAPSVAVDPQATRLSVRLMRAGGAPGAGDLPAAVSPIAGGTGLAHAASVPRRSPRRRHAPAHAHQRRPRAKPPHGRSRHTVHRAAPRGS